MGGKINNHCVPGTEPQRRKGTKKYKDQCRASSCKLYASSLACSLKLVAYSPAWNWQGNKRWGSYHDSSLSCRH